MTEEMHKASIDPAEAAARPVTILHSALLADACPWLVHGFSTRAGGRSDGPYSSLNPGLHVGDDPARVLANRRILAATIAGAASVCDSRQAIHHAPGLAGRFVASAQAHGNGVVFVSEAEAGRGALSMDTCIPDADALATSTAWLPLMLFVADCVPLLIADPGRRIFAVVHAGWRGTASAITSQVIRSLQQDHGCRPPDLAAWIGPAIGACCYEVGQEVAQAVERATVGDPEPPEMPISADTAPPESSGRVKLDVKDANRRQLLRAGLIPERIELSPDCTNCDRDRFFSFRRDKVTGRMAMFGMIARG